MTSWLSFLGHKQCGLWGVGEPRRGPGPWPYCGHQVSVGTTQVPSASDKVHPTGFPDQKHQLGTWLERRILIPSCIYCMELWVPAVPPSDSDTAQVPEAPT